MSDTSSSLPTTVSRREFIAKSAVAAAGIMIVPRFVLGGKGYTAPSDQLVIAGVGVGGKHAWLEVFQEFFNM